MDTDGRLMRKRPTVTVTGMRSTLETHQMSTLADSIAPTHSRSKRYGLFVCLMAALAGLLFGLDIGVISGALPFIAKHFVLNDRSQEWIVSSMMVGAAIGALGAGWLRSEEHTSELQSRGQ